MLLEWPEHDKKLVEGLSNLHQLNAFHDVTLSAEGKQIKAHRVILASASTYFKVIINDVNGQGDSLPRPNSNIRFSQAI